MGKQNQKMKKREREIAHNIIRPPGSGIWLQVSKVFRNRTQWKLVGLDWVLSLVVNIVFNCCCLLPAICLREPLGPELPGGSGGKGVCWQCRRPGFNPWVGKISWRRKWQPTPVLLPGKFHGWRSLVGYSPWGRRVEHNWVTSLRS